MLKKLIGGHRGSPKKAHENTLESFSAAIADGADFNATGTVSINNGKTISITDANFTADSIVIGNDASLNVNSSSLVTARTVSISEGGGLYGEIKVEVAGASTPYAYKVLSLTQG